MMVKGDKMASQKDKGYNDPAFAEYRTRTLAKAVEDTANATSIEVFKEQIYNLKSLSAMYRYGDLDPYDLILLNRIIDFVERSKSLVDKKYTEDVWHIMAELYSLKRMLTHQNIYTPDDIRKEINEIVDYANNHLK